jgi:subtilisin family serine protease
MMWRRWVLVVLVMCVTALSSASERMPFATSGSAGERTAVVVNGKVVHVLPPSTVILEGDIEIVVPSDVGWEGIPGFGELNPGDEIVVAGHQEAGAPRRIIEAGGVRVVSGNRRVERVAAPVCRTPTLFTSLELDSARPIQESSTRFEKRSKSAGVEFESAGHHDGGVDFEAVGVVTELRPPDRFVLSDQRTYFVDGLTVYDDRLISYTGLAVGQYLALNAVYEGNGSYRAARIKYEGDQSDGHGYVKLEGTIEGVSPTELTLSDGSVVLLATTTVFNGDADRFEDIRPGWHAYIYALDSDTGDLIARSVRCEDLESATTAGQEFQPHQAVVVLAEGAAAEVVADRHDAAVTGTISSRSVLLTWEREIDDELLAQLEADTDIEAVEPNFLFRDPESVRRRFVIVDRSPTSSKYTSQAAVLRHKITKAHSTADGSGVVVAVIDTGVDRCHPLLADHLVSGGLDLVDGDLSPWETRGGLDEDTDGEIDEAVGHGTFVASLVALAAPGARILPYRVLDDDGGGTAFNLAIALADAIERGADVINLSLAYHERSVVVDLLLEEAEKRGVVVVAAAGNDGDTHLPFPAIDSHVLAVTALRPDAAGLAEFANRDDKTIVAAIGEEVYGGLYGGRYGSSSGTSLAAPFAAAGAALAKGLDPEVSAGIVRRLLIQSGVPVVDGTWEGRSLDLAQAMVLIHP